MTYRGLTWDHPRGYNALAAAEKNGGPVRWDVQPLEGFESAPIAELCARYDLVVLDHPHLGEAMAAECLQPLESLFSSAQLEAFAATAVGPSFTSYEMNGKLWALPLDAASQVMALRPDLIDTVPKNWDEVVALSESGNVALSLAGPHAFLSLLSIIAALEPTTDMSNGNWPNDSVLARAYSILQQLFTHASKAALGLNPIGLLEHMSTHDDIALIPLIYGYVNYARGGREKPLRFHDAPRVGAGPPGSIIGGTGIALSQCAQVSDALRDHLMWLMSPEAQSGFIPDHDGQPSLRSAWADADVNAASGGFYDNTRDTLEAATIRPRHNGYIAFQSDASAYLRMALDTDIDANTVAARMTEMFHANRLERSLA
ncbi:extracellular solute-binding protein [Pacificibacter marinus]|uniref:Bacterial extracellular solute-binding protein n=1 Tax=Pacificibacter marinus TaxID=658057 RepID=A0A1Y5RNW1_9RHOB|nr:extracellular solute-binding protein [Pacificibacter marinus]SEL30704.1 carbohydrate ABC transporter substrate-binding protein, CUT1 family [Pacificibacter marinus]SLN22051.1 hypothetical protein PAM7971_00654 [Pacificibacter marinus]